MGQLERYWNRDFRVYAYSGCSPEQVKEIIGLIEHPVVLEPPSEHAHCLAGRSAMVGGSISAVGDVVVKTYRRGGMLRFFLGHLHMRLAQSRSRKEFKILERVRELGINAPEPVAYIEYGEFWYKAWLVTKRIPGAVTLIDIAYSDESRAIQLGKEVARQIGVLIRHGVYHVDLHPGNIVISKDNQVYLVDFDKAYNFNGGLNELRDRYLRRWRRAVLKHGLPEVLSEAISLELRNNYE